MPADKQYADAKRVLGIIETHAFGQGQHLTYGGLAELLGYTSAKHSRHIGQVCSLIDAACFWAALPMLSLEKVRRENGERNPESFQNAFMAVKGALVANAEAHRWSAEDLRRISRTLDEHMNDESATLQWKRIAAFGQNGLNRMAGFV